MAAGGAALRREQQTPARREEQSLRMRTLQAIPDNRWEWAARTVKGCRDTAAKLRRSNSARARAAAPGDRERRSLAGTASWLMVRCLFCRKRWEQQHL